MLNNLFKKEAPQEPKKNFDNDRSKPENYYGRFKLEDVDDCVDEIQLNKWALEVQLDLENNKVNFERTQDLKYKKHMNFCKFFLYRIKDRIAEIKKVQHISRGVTSKIRKTSPERFQIMVNAIVERYPGVDLQHIINIIDKKY